MINLALISRNEQVTKPIPNHISKSSQWILSQIVNLGYSFALSHIWMLPVSFFFFNLESCNDRVESQLVCSAYEELVMIRWVKWGRDKLFILQLFLNSQHFSLLNVVNLNLVVRSVSNDEESLSLSRESKMQNLNFWQCFDLQVNLRTRISVDQDLWIKPILCSCNKSLLLVGREGCKSMPMRLQVLLSSIWGIPNNNMVSLKETDAVVINDSKSLSVVPKRSSEVMNTYWIFI